MITIHGRQELRIVTSSNVSHTKLKGRVCFLSSLLVLNSNAIMLLVDLSGRLSDVRSISDCLLMLRPAYHHSSYYIIVVLLAKCC